MKLVLFGSVLAAVLAISAGCGKSFRNASTPAPSPSSEKSTSANTITAVGTLKTVRMYNFIPDTPQNSLSLSGNGLKTSYQAQYNFNSGTNTVLKIMRVNANVTCSGANGSLIYDQIYFLASKSGRVQIDLFKVVPLEQNTDYTLEVKIDRHNCSEKLNVTLDVLAFVDNLDPYSAQPALARLCSGNAGNSPRSMLFFTGQMPYGAIVADDLSISNSSGYTATNGKIFIDPDHFCGNQFQPKSGKISMQYAVDGSNVDSMLHEAVSENGQNLDVRVRFDNAAKTASVMCSKEDTISIASSVHSFDLFDCKNLIADENILQKLK